MKREEETTQEKQIHVVTPPYVPGRTDDEVGALLRAHGCVIIRSYLENQKVIFPIGTKSEVKLITTAARYRLTLPSGLVVIQVEAPNRDYWLLFVDMWTVQSEESDGE